jgi:NitT/TauT family transport system substrate-binding protein
MRIRRWIVSSVGALCIIAGLVSAAHAEPLRVGWHVWVGYGPLFVAAEKGFFVEEGVDVELIRIDDHTARMAALYAGQVDALTAATQEVVAVSEPDEEPLACVLALLDSQGADGILAINEVQSIADLKGKSVAFIDRSISQFYLNVLLKEAGLSEANIEVVDLPSDDAMTAFLLQEVDAVVTYEPYLTQGKSVAHGHLLTDTSQRHGLLGDCVATKRSTFNDRKKEFRAVARAWEAAVRYVAAHPDEANEIMARNMGDWLEDPAVFAEMLRGVAFYGVEENRKYFGTPDDPGPIYQTMQYAIDIWTEHGLLDFELSPADVILHGIWDE